MNINDYDDVANLYDINVPATFDIDFFVDETRRTGGEVKEHLMEQEYTVSYFDDPDEDAWGIVGHGLQAFNEGIAGKSGHQRLCIVLRAADQSILGGLIGSTYWGWLYIDLLWIPEELRGRGYGHRLLEMAEEEGRRRGAGNAYLDTFDFQAPEFYRQHGYRVFGELPDFPAGRRRYFFTKQL